MPPDHTESAAPPSDYRTLHLGGNPGSHEVIRHRVGGFNHTSAAGQLGTAFGGGAPSALLTDYYQLNMVQAYVENGMTDTAVFELFFRKLPARRGFLVAAGLAQAIEFLEALRFSAEEIDWLRRSSLFREPLLKYLSEFRFTGDVDALDEGTVFFPDEPVLRITAPLPEAQLIETVLINILHFQTMIATKAARCVQAAPGKMLVDFGLRRAHGLEAGLFAARAAYIAGFAGTATVLAKARFGIPIYGTMAHSFIQAHDDEIEAFERFAVSHPDNVVLLIDTYDTEEGARKLVELAPRLASNGISISAVRIDSGDLAEHARLVRQILDDGGLGSAQIFASGGLDEYRLEKLVSSGAPISGFGVGTSLTTSSDCPSYDCAYKLQEYAGIARRKRSEGKATWPGRKQVYRRYDSEGTMTSDLLTRAERSGRGEALVQPVMRSGKRFAPLPTLEQTRVYTAGELERLPRFLHTLTPDVAYPVAVSSSLRRLAEEVDSRTAGEAVAE